MDMGLCIHQWLLGVAFMLLLHQCDTANGSGSWLICPQGQLYHAANSRLSRTYATCCYPTRCGVGEEVVPCQMNGTQDTCRLCHRHYNQSQRTSSFTMNKRCVKWPLDENCKNKHGQKDFDSWKTRRCLCELERGLMFILPELVHDGAPKSAFCQLMDQCKPGYEPTVDGKCRKCEHGYFKAKRGHNLCEPQTECHELGLDLLTGGGFIADNNCSEPVIFTTPKPAPPVIKPEREQTSRPPDPPVDKTTKASTAATARTGSSHTVKENEDQDSDSLLWPIILAVAFLLLIVLTIAVVLFYRKRKGMSNSCALFKSNDVEKNNGSTVGHTQFKNSNGNGVLTEPQMMVVTKGVNNNINGGLPQHAMGNHRHLHSQHNGNSVHFSEGSNVDTQVFQNQKNSYQTRMSPTSRPGILRNGGDHSQQVMFAPRSQDASIDSIGREKLHVNGFEANQDLGENDPLLISEGGRSVAVPGGHDMFHNTSYAASNSPPLPMSSVNPAIYPLPGASGHLILQNAPVVSHSAGNANPTFSNSSGNLATSAPPHTSHQVTFAPTADTVTFKRSISVIASPEGEVEEEELEANVPRFSQILPDRDDAPSVSESNPILRMIHDKENNPPMDSPQRELTHQMRLPQERLQHRLHANPVGSNPQRNQRNSPHQGGPPALFRATSQPTPDSNIPDHCIMDLKEQQLANSLTSSLDDSSPAGTRLKLGSDSSDTGLLKLEDFTSSFDQNQTKVKVLPGANNANSDSSSSSCGAKESNSNSKLPEFGMFTIGTGGSAQNTLERKRTGNNSLQRKRFYSGSNRQNSVERKRRSSGSESAQNTLEFKRSVSGEDKQKPCVKYFNLEDGETEGKKLRLGRTVSFESDEDRSYDSTMPKQVGESLSSTESSQGPYVDTAVDLRKEPRVAEEGYDGENDSDEDTETKQRQSDLDLSSSEEGQASPMANTYRRCQSESASSSTEAVQKPPPRSLSEEKPLKQDRPIAKVKPMPPSDSSVNKLVPDGVEEDAATVANSSSGAGNIMAYSSDSSSGEENIPSELAHRQEGNRTGESNSDEEDGRQ